MDILYALTAQLSLKTITPQHFSFNHKQIFLEQLQKALYFSHPLYFKEPNFILSNQ